MVVEQREQHPSPPIQSREPELVSSFGALRLLARGDNSGGASADIPTQTFDAENLLLIHIRISGYSASGVARVQFNGDTGTTAYAYSVSDNFAAPSTAVAGVAAGINVAQTAITGGRALISMIIRNFPGQEHGITIIGNSGSLAAATAPTIVNGAGLWTTTSQITRVNLNVGTGGGTLNSGTEIIVYGLQPG
jgi:hypothetical protein